MPIPPPVRIVRKRSRIAGWGVYAGQPINKNKRIVDYAGEKISVKEADRREHRYQAKGHIWCFTLNRRWVRDAKVGGNVAHPPPFANWPGCCPLDTHWRRLEQAVVSFHQKRAIHSRTTP